MLSDTECSSANPATILPPEPPLVQTQAGLMVHQSGQ
jgi:hypothetical protein